MAKITVQTEWLLSQADRFLKCAEGEFHCSQPGCPVVADWSDLIKVMDADPPGPYCRNHATFCSSCKHPTAINSGIKLSDTVTYCRKCYSSYICSSCGQSFSDGGLVTDTKGRRLCESCYPKHWRKCVSCDEVVSSENSVVDPENDVLCTECFNEIWTPCDTCNETVKRDDVLQEETKWKDQRNQHRSGCENCFAKCYSCEKVTKPKDEMSEGPDKEYYCEDCYGEHWRSCEECNEEVANDEIHYVEEYGEYCDSCYRDKFDRCEECKEVFAQQEMELGPDGDRFCEQCWEKLGHNGQLHPSHAGLKLPEGITYNKNDRYLLELKRLLPISVQDLKKLQPRLATALKDLLIFAKGANLTPEIVAAFEETLPKEDYRIATSVWRSTQQRSHKGDKPQLVLNLLAGPTMLGDMKADGSYNLFESINETSRQSSHPMIPDQLGWARLELHPEGAYLLVDEIQTDHANALDRIVHETQDGKTYKEHIMKGWGVTSEEFDKICANLKKHIKDFPDAMLKAVTEFARANNYKKIYYHTYESGRKLKRNSPPKSLYTDVPKRNFFAPTNERPFDLEGDFLGREARRQRMRELIKNSK